MALTGLLLLTSSTLNLRSRTRLNLSAAKKRLSGVLYVYPWKVDTDMCIMDSNTRQKFSRISSALYSQATSQCPHLDVRLLLKKPNSIIESVKQPLDLIMVESGFQPCVTKAKVDLLMNELFLKKTENFEVQFLEEPAEEKKLMEYEDLAETIKTYDVVALGGTFDRMHNAHKILLTEAVLRCNKEIIVGVTDDEMIKSKLLFELIEPCERRLERVKNFLDDVAPFLKHRIVPLTDPFGPTVTDKDIDFIVVSSETVKGAAKINEIRESKGFKPLDVHHIELFVEPEKQSEHEEDKISSSSQRIRILGERLGPAKKPPSSPYIVGLTGGIASGKSTICAYLETLGVRSINCDQMGHEAYKSGTPCFDAIVDAFGESILVEGTRAIDRRKLGFRVFENKVEMKRLTDIVWPEIRRLVEKRVSELVAEGQKVIVLDAAVLLEAGWDSMCHDVWVVVIPKEEAIRRVQNRDNLSVENAEARVNSQVSNHERVNRATVVFSSFWEVSFTRRQVDKAWTQLKPVIDML